MFRRVLGAIWGVDESGGDTVHVTRPRLRFDNGILNGSNGSSLQRSTASTLQRSTTTKSSKASEEPVSPTSPGSTILSFFKRPSGFRNGEIRLAFTKSCFEQIMSDPDHFQNFKEFNASLMCHENIDYYEAIVELDAILLRKVPSYIGPTSLSRFVYAGGESPASLLYSNPFIAHSSPPVLIPAEILPHFLYFHACFLADDAPTEINLPAAERQNISQKLLHSSSDQVMTDVFDSATDEVLSMLYFDSFAKYVESRVISGPSSGDRMCFSSAPPVLPEPEVYNPPSSSIPTEEPTRTSQDSVASAKESEHSRMNATMSFSLPSPPPSPLPLKAMLTRPLPSPSATNSDLKVATTPVAVTTEEEPLPADAESTVVNTNHADPMIEESAPVSDDQQPTDIEKPPTDVITVLSITEDTAEDTLKRTTSQSTATSKDSAQRSLHKTSIAHIPVPVAPRRYSHRLTFSGTKILPAPASSSSSPPKPKHIPIVIPRIADPSVNPAVSTDQSRSSIDKTLPRIPNSMSQTTDYSVNTTDVPHQPHLEVPQHPTRPPLIPRHSTLSTMSVRSHEADQFPVPPIPRDPDPTGPKSLFLRRKNMPWLHTGPSSPRGSSDTVRSETSVPSPTRSSMDNTSMHSSRSRMSMVSMKMKLMGAKRKMTKMVEKVGHKNKTYVL
ncbi:hypothetical protein DFS34DRAFT_696964 [Phlyctochytrium arcticum]|nr:hypothetical protein DFS34DRAFT_696964 [Phlyctochytrium arcticum]